MNQLPQFDQDHAPNPAFERALRQRVVAIYRKEETSMKKLRKFGITGMTLAGLVTGLVFTAALVKIYSQKPSTSQSQQATKQQTDPLRSVSVTPTYNSGGGNAAATGIAGQSSDGRNNIRSMANVPAAAGFRPLAVQKPIQNEVLTELFTTQGLSGGNETSLYISYGSASTLLYQLIETPSQAPQQELPAEVEKVQLTINGTAVTASRNEFWNSSTPKEQIYPGTPRQTISFVYKGIAVDITEYGQVSLDQLKTIAANLVQQ